VIAEALGRPVTWHGEGPLWDPAGERLLVVDMLAGAVVQVTGADAGRRFDVGSRVAAVVRPRRAGGYAVAREHDVALFDAGFRFEHSLATLLADPGARLNEGGCDAAGRLFVGSTAYDYAQGAAALYRVEPDGTSAVALDGVTISNGLQWSHDGTRAFYIDTRARRVDVFDYDAADGSFRDRRVLADLDAVPTTAGGGPDGMTIDAEGGLWVSFWGGGAVCRLDAETGAVTERVEVPGVGNVSACAFGGAALDTLYITTSRQHLPEGAEPAAGAVFAVRPGVRGTILPQFAG
jgi:sugar lactone lactonase YvrE